MYAVATASTQPPSVSYMVVGPWCMAGLSLEAIAQPSCPTCRLGCCRLMMYWQIILCSPTIPVFLPQAKSCRYGMHYGPAMDQVSQAYGHRCRMARRGSSIVLPVISWIQKNMGSHIGTGYTRFPFSPFARCIKCRLLLCLPSLHVYLRCFSRSYLFDARKLST